MAYDLNDPRKCRLRKWRRDFLTERIKTIKDGRRQITTLSLVINKLDADDTRGRARVSEAVDFIRKQVKCAYADIEQFSALPHDRDDTCRCTSNRYHALPPWLHTQTFDLSSL